MWARVSGVPNTFQMSACSATIRSVFRSPPPPIMIGSRALDRQRLDPEAVEGVAAAGRARHLAAVEQDPRIAPTASASQSSRCPNPDPKSMPKARCSPSNQAPPMPMMARPPLMWSIVVMHLTARPGLRNVFAPTNSPSRIRSVAWATAASAV